MTRNQLLQLLLKRLTGEFSPEEAIELEAWTASVDGGRQWIERITSEAGLAKEVEVWKKIDPALGYAKWLDGRKRTGKLRIRHLIRGVAAAALLAVAVLALNRIRKNRSVPPPAMAKNSLILPGRNTATLTLADGRRILLDSLDNVEVGMQGKSKLVKTDSGTVTYTTLTGNRQEVVYNDLATPRAGQYQLILADHSHVWLNNLSSIHYPAFFAGTDREVEMTGEAYFEIADDPGKPFVVNVNGKKIRVLGTSFNIKSYPDEDNTQATLLTGTVQVTNGTDTTTLRPNEQARWNGMGEVRVLRQVPAEAITSWKNGFFYFGRASLKEVMRQLARWYDVEVNYEGTPPDVQFEGKIDRNLPLNELIKSLENQNNIHFQIQGRSIIVMPPPINH
jgi:transmembrane sensor